MQEELEIKTKELEQCIEELQKYRDGLTQTEELLDLDGVDI